MALSEETRKALAEQSDYEFGDKPRNGQANDPSLQEYNIFALAEAAAERYQNRQAEERRAAEELRALREKAAESEPEAEPDGS